MTKREYCESRESIAYYSGLNGLEIKGIEYGIDDYIYCVSGAWGGGKAARQYHKCKVQYTRRGGALYPGAWVPGVAQRMPRHGGLITLYHRTEKTHDKPKRRPAWGGVGYGFPP